MPKIHPLELLSGNVAMDIDTDLTLQRYQHLQFLSKSDMTLLSFSFHLLESVDQRERLACMFSPSLPTREVSVFR